jgi:hypothetical protein
VAPLGSRSPGNRPRRHRSGAFLGALGGGDAGPNGPIRLATDLPGVIDGDTLLTRNCIIKDTPEIPVILSRELLGHLRRRSAELGIPLRWLVAGLICDTVEGLASGGLPARSDAPADRHPG